MQNLIESITSAYANITEAKKIESKFSVGDKVGVGAFSPNTGLYVSHDTGTVSGVDKRGAHTVTHDKWKEHDSVGNVRPTESLFDANGQSTTANRIIVSKEDHEKNVATSQKEVERANDMNIVMQHLNFARKGNGSFAPLDKGQTDHIKSLLDKHCCG